MAVTTFNKNDGSISSYRVTIGQGSNKVSLSNYIGSTRGGTTFYNNGVSARFNNKGQSMGTAIKIGSSTSYYNSSGTPASRMKLF